MNRRRRRLSSAAPFRPAGGGVGGRGPYKRAAAVGGQSRPAAVSAMTPPTLVSLVLVLVSASSAGRLPSSLRLDQLERTQLDAPRFERPRLAGTGRLEEPRLEVEQHPVLEEPPRRPWSTGPRSSRGEQADSDTHQGGSSERLRRNRHRKRKRPSAEHLLFLRSRGAECQLLYYVIGLFINQNVW